ncbi:hypothetical protein [Cryobacterium roopkundense]|uniref:Uncharacterized protein n=1 Tax=Cryobacterium roopkundense TaxID=1001240 RepID=A0A7W9E5Q8_9MICO|nr:hypothetical protein [Cryobacterium roopkundense]MBB5643538.1 hypothetical protein [Cryobacterium roopkundense]
MADNFDPTTSPSYQQGAAMSGVPITTPVRERTHEEIVRSRLGWIVAGVWVIAGGVISNFIVGFGVGFAATYR